MDDNLCMNVLDINKLEIYKDKEEIIITESKILSYNHINIFLENLDLNKIKVLNCLFNYNNTSIKLILKSNDLTMEIYDYDSQIKDLMANLPVEINILIFHKINNMLEGFFTNLPISLQKIIFNVETIKYRHNFNFLFKTKLPFDCNMFVCCIKENSNCKVKDCDLQDMIILKDTTTGTEKIVKYVFFHNYSDDQNYNVLRIMSGMGGLAFSS